MGPATYRRPPCWQPGPLACPRPAGVAVESLPARRDPLSEPARAKLGVAGGQAGAPLGRAARPPVRRPGGGRGGEARRVVARLVGQDRILTEVSAQCHIPLASCLALSSAQPSAASCCAPAPASPAPRRRRARRSHRRRRESHSQQWSQSDYYNNRTATHVHGGRTFIKITTTAPNRA